MINNNANLTDVTVLNAGINSRTVRGVYEYGDAESITISLQQFCQKPGLFK
jgi:hypothetical protein